MREGWNRDRIQGLASISVMHTIPVPGFERYRIDDEGTVYGILAEGRALRPHPNKKGYLYVSLRRDGRSYVRYIHILVCQAFHGPRPEPHYHASHVDGHNQNNRATNLAWETPEQNQARRNAHGRTQYARGEAQGLAVLTEDKVRAIRATKASQYELARRFGVSRATIAQVRNYRTWRHVR